MTTVTATDNTTANTMAPEEENTGFFFKRFAGRFAAMEQQKLANQQAQQLQQSKRQLSKAETEALTYVQQKWPTLRVEDLKAAILDGPNGLLDGIFRAKAQDQICAACKEDGTCACYGKSRAAISVENIKTGNGSRLRINFGYTMQPCGKSIIHDDRAKEPVERLFKRSGLTTFQRTQTFENFSTDSCSVLVYAKEQAFSVSGNNRWLVIAGNPGTGKSHLGCAIVSTKISTGYAAHFTSVVDMLDFLRHGFDDHSFDSRMNYLKTVKCLVLDDFGKERVTRFVAEKLFQILDYRYRNDLQTIFTTNAVSPDEILDSKGSDYEPLLSRMAERCTWISITDVEDHRSYKPKPYEVKVQPKADSSSSISTPVVPVPAAVVAPAMSTSDPTKSTCEIETNGTLPTIPEPKLEKLDSVLDTPVVTMPVTNTETADTEVTPVVPVVKTPMEMTGPMESKSVVEPATATIADTPTVLLSQETQEAEDEPYWMSSKDAPSFRIDTSGIGDLDLFIDEIGAIWYMNAEGQKWLVPPEDPLWGEPLEDIETDAKDKEIIPDVLDEASVWNFPDTGEAEQPFKICGIDTDEILPTMPEFKGLTPVMNADTPTIFSSSSSQEVQETQEAENGSCRTSSKDISGSRIDTSSFGKLELFIDEIGAIWYINAEGQKCFVPPEDSLWCELLEHIEAEDKKVISDILDESSAYNLSDYSCRAKQLFQSVVDVAMSNTRDVTFISLEMSFGETLATSSVFAGSFSITFITNAQTDASESLSWQSVIQNLPVRSPPDQKRPVSWSD